MRDERKGPHTLRDVLGDGWNVFPLESVTTFAQTQSTVEDSEDLMCQPREGQGWGSPFLELLTPCASTSSLLAPSPNPSSSTSGVHSALPGWKVPISIFFLPPQSTVRAQGDGLGKALALQM